MQNMGAITPLKVIQDYWYRYQSKAPMQLPIIKLILTDILSRTVSKLSQIIVQILDEKQSLGRVFNPLWGLKGNVHCSC